MAVVNVATPQETLLRFVEYGRKKSKLPLGKLIVQGFMSGWWLGFWGHVATSLASGFDVPGLEGFSKFFYGLAFPGGLIAIVLTGAELYTGNVAAMTLLAFHDGWTLKSVLDLVKNWVVVCLSNLVGAMFVAYFVSYLGGTFASGRPHDYLIYLGAGKTSHNFLEAFVLSIACNTVVCLTIWGVMAANDLWSRMFIVWYLIGSFVCLDV
eukprot:Trichotokara_eunicae@DN6045_c0_g1_i1.p1